MRMFIIVIAGPPGSGKGTQSKLLADNYGFVHLSTGDMLRNEIEKGTELGKFAKSRIDDGNFVPDYVACEMIRNFLEKQKSIKGIVFDGFPRTYDQCIEFGPLLEQYNFMINLFIDFNVEKDELIRRLLNRSVLLNRPDDSDLSIIEHRFDLYEELTRPVVDYYKDKSYYNLVDGNHSIAEVFMRIEELIHKQKEEKNGEY